MTLVPLNVHYIKHYGIFDLNGMYQMIYNWFVDRGFEVQERKFKHKVPSAAGEEEEIWWSAWIRETDYIKNWIDIVFFFYDIKEVEVVKEGKKKKLTRARVLIEINGKVETDWQGKWQRSAFLSQLQKFYEKFIIKKDIDTIWWDKLYYNMLKLHASIKEWLDQEAKANAFYDVW